MSEPTIRTDYETKETVFTTADGREFRVKAVSGAAALKAFREWEKSR
jgi:hypothetical protein